MNWLLKLITRTISDMFIGFLDLFGSLINNMFETMYQISRNIPLNSAKEFIMYLSLAIVGLVIIKQAIDVYALQVNGDPDLDPLEMVTRLCISVAVIMSSGFIMDTLMNMASVVSGDVMSTMISNQDFSEKLLNINSIFNVLSGGMSGLLLLFGIVYLIAVLVFYIAFVFKVAKRGAELILFELLIPIFACDLLTTNRERWNAFFTELMVCIFGYIVQLICMFIFMSLLGLVITGEETINYNFMVVSLVWIAMTVSAPKWLAKFSYSSGIGNAMKGSARTVGMMLPQILKGIK